MGQQVEFKSKPEIKIWEARRERLSKVETRTLYIRIGGEVFEVKGRIRRRHSDDHASLYHVLTGKYFLTESASLRVAIQQKRIESLNEMEVLAWSSQ
jgi:hypothetical protein